MELKRSLILLLVVLVLSLGLWYLTFSVLGITAWNHAQPKAEVLPVPKPVQLAQPSYDKINLDGAL